MKLIQNIHRFRNGNYIPMQELDIVYTCRIKIIDKLYIRYHTSLWSDLLDYIVMINSEIREDEVDVGS